MTVLSVSDLHKTYGDITALNNLDLELEDGELFGFLGPNGAGKTTTISILTGQRTADSGTVTLLGHNPADTPVELRRDLGILPERESPPSFLTPREYFEFIGDVRNIDNQYLIDRIDEWTDRLDFTDHLDTLTTDLSRGQQQKVMIIQAFLHEPAFVFIDEPLVNLDPIMQERVKEFFVEYSNNGNTIFLSTHDISVAEEICSRVGIINDGELVADKDPATLSEGESLLDLFDVPPQSDSTEGS